MLPVVILSGLCVLTALRILTTSIVDGNIITTYEFTSAHFGAFTSVGLCFLSFFIVRKYYKYVLGLTLFFGLFSLLNFTVTAYSWNLTLGGLSITVEPVALLVGILVIVINFDKISRLWNTKRKETIQDANDEFESDLLKYKVQYRNSSSEELQKVANDIRFKPGAIEAAKQVLKERQVISRYD